MNKNPQILLDLISLREEWRKLEDYCCFWASPDNQRGLRLTPTIEPGKISVEMTIEKEHSGFPGIAHGGIPFTILDGLMGWYVMAHYGRAGFTVKSSIEYFAPLIVGRAYLFQVINDPQILNSTNMNVNLVGQVFEKNSFNKIFIELKGTYFLPNRKTAEKVLGIPIQNELATMFPDI